MLDEKKLKTTFTTVIELLRADGNSNIVELLQSSEIESRLVEWSGYNNDTEHYSISIISPISVYIKNKTVIQSIEEKIDQTIQILLKGQYWIRLDAVYVIPKAIPKLDWGAVSNEFTKETLIEAINDIKATMINTATYKANINSVNDSYIWSYIKVHNALRALRLENPNSFSELWMWYHYYKAQLPTYESRRTFIRNMYGHLLDVLNDKKEVDFLSINVNLSEWERVGRSVSEIQSKYIIANTEEQRQSIGLFCRETLISLAQAVYDPLRHPALDGVVISKTDSKRMLEAYISVKLQGRSNERLRKYAKATIDLANDLTHDRSAQPINVALCSLATIALVNFIGIIEDKQLDP